MQCVAADNFATCPKDVLIVEGDPLLALDFEDRLLRLGVQSVRSAGTVATALDLIAGRAPDFALLDVGLFSEKSFAVAERLTALRIPFAFVTGYCEDQVPAAFADRPMLSKPYSQDALQALLCRFGNTCP
jgi:CheY-like chemotaxis protein